MNAELDVIVYGTVCLDLIWRVDRLAAPGSYEPILEERRMIGGEASNTAIALSRWGLRVALVGTATGDDEDGRRLRAMFASDAPEIDIRGINVIRGLQTAYCTCIATPDGHRTMYGLGFTDMQCPVLDPDLARSARLFTMDPNAYQAGLGACAIAAAAGAEIVAMDYTGSPEVNRAAAITVTSSVHVASSGSMSAWADYAAATRDRDGCTTVVTCGEQGCFVAESGRTGERAAHIPAYLVEPVVDSTGAGDIFRAGLIYGHLNGWEILTTARFASAAAALNCGKMGGWGGIASVAEIAAFQAAARTRPVPIQ
jgi:sugar/nucleoside kinase (ribokinase family)